MVMEIRSLATLVGEWGIDTKEISKEMQIFHISIEG